MLKKLMYMCIALLLGVSSLPHCAYADMYAPTLRYQNAGTYKLWTEEAYYSSPVICDLEGDGKKEIVYSNYSITVLDAQSGDVKWRVNSGKDRSQSFVEVGGNNGHTWTTVEVKDIDRDGNLEIISIHGGGAVSVLDKNGYFKSGWPQYPVKCSLRSLEVDDLDMDGNCEILVGAGTDSHQSIWVYNYNGTVRSGWPQLNNDTFSATSNKDFTETGWSYGIFMDGISTGDIDNDGDKEIIVATDTSFASAYHDDGTLIKANSYQYGGRTWAKIPFYESYSSEIRMDNEGWGLPVDGTEQREELYKAELGHAKPAIVDLDYDGSKEIIITAIMANRKYIDYPPTEYMTLFVVNADRTRYVNQALGYDWCTIPTDLGKPLVQSNTSISSMVEQRPVVDDLDGDGIYEILFSSYNGRVECFNPDKRSPYAWPYSLTKRSSPMLQYASSPICADLNYDGKKEVIFASFYDESQYLSHYDTGYLYILDCYGKLISKTPLPQAKEINYHNGALASPTVGDIDGDGRYEIAVNTLHGAVCIYDL